MHGYYTQNRLEIPEAGYGSPATQGGCARPKAAAMPAAALPENALVVGGKTGYASRQTVFANTFFIFMRIL